MPSFVFEFTAKKFLRQQDALKQIHLGWTQDFIDTNLRAVKVSQENQCQAAFEAALLSFQYHGLTTKHQAPAEDAWSWPSEAALSSEAALTGLSSTYQCFPTSIKKKDKVFNHYNDFFAAQDEHQKEMMKVESSRDCQAHEHEQKNPGVKHAKIYEWEKTQLSGGQEVYQQVKINKKANEDVWSFYKPYQHLFNAFSNEWNLCQDFNLGGHGACLTLSWDTILKFLGFIKNLEELDVPKLKKSAMLDFFYSIVSGND